MAESLVAVFALKRLLACMNSLVLLQVMFEFESFAAVATLELAQVRSVLVVSHMPLKLVEGWELF